MSMEEKNNIIESITANDQEGKRQTYLISPKYENIQNAPIIPDEDAENAFKQYIPENPARVLKPPQANAEASIAFGEYTYVYPSGETSMAINYQNEVFGKRSFAANVGNKVVGNYSTAFGRGNWVGYKNETQHQSPGNPPENHIHDWTEYETITPSAAIAFGTNNYSLADNTIACGNNARALGVNSIAGGNNTRSHGKNSIAFGELCDGEYDKTQTLSYGDSSLAIGAGVQTYGKGSISMGIQTSTGYMPNANNFGEGSLAGGIYSQARGNYSIAFGTSVVANGINSAAFGNHTQAANNQFVIGQYNKDDSDALFIVGSGNSNYTKNAFTVGDGFITINGTKLTEQQIHGYEEQLQPGTYNTTIGIADIGFTPRVCIISFCYDDYADHEIKETLSVPWSHIKEFEGEHLYICRWGNFYIDFNSEKQELTFDSSADQGTCMRYINFI